MKFYVAYRYTGADILVLKERLERLDSILNELGHECFIFFRDIQKWGEVDVEMEDVLKIGYNEMDKCDGVLVLLESSEKSEGMLLEIGRANAVGKRVLLLKKKGLGVGLKDTISESVEFDDFDEVKGLLDAAIKTR